MIYLYESCIPTLTNATKKTQIGQTYKLEYTNIANTIFKDSIGNCWNYLGEYESSYIPPDNVFYIFYSGNFLTNTIEIGYPDCNSCQATITSNCVFTYYVGVRCDNGGSVNVKVCNVSPTGTLKLVPTIGQVFGVRNPSGDDFCVTIVSTSPFVDTEYQISTPAWKDYTCDTCPLYKSYLVDSCDGYSTNMRVYQYYTNPTIPEYTAVDLNVDDVCYVIKSYEGITCEYAYNETTTPTIIQTFISCNECLINFYQKNI
jgi:hypothetical protein